MDGTPFGRYRLIELLGRGGMGEVWRAHDTATDRIVAIKVLPAHFSDNEDFKQRFRREAHAAARLNTPHVVPIHNYGEIDGRLYVDMRLIEGRDLASVLADGPIAPGRAVRIIEGIALALHAAHKVGLLHRDVKPSNILLDENDFAYLIDFGIARAADETRLTKSGNTIGTFQYIAPERLGTRTEDARADIYSLACVLCECLTGHPPFDAATMAQLVEAHLHTPPPQPSITQPNVPAQIDPVIATGMAKDPDQRYATTVALADAAHDAITTPLGPAGKPTLLGDAAPATPTPAPTLRDEQSPRAARPTLLDPGSTTPAPAPESVRQQPAELNHAATQQRPPGWAPVPPPRPADRPPPHTGTPPLRRWWLRVGIPGVLLIVAVFAVPIVLMKENSNGPQHREPVYGPQVTLPFTGLNGLSGVAVDSAGTVYVADSGNDRVVELAAGSATQSVLPFTGLGSPASSVSAAGVAVDAAGNIYVADMPNNRVVKLAAGSSTQSVLPFAGLDGPEGVAVDGAGNVYVADTKYRVVKLAAGSSTQSVLPFTGIAYLYGALAVDTAGNVYTTDQNNRVVKLAAGSSTQTELPFIGIHHPTGVAVDATGNVYVTEQAPGGVVKLAAGSATQAVLPFTGLSGPIDVAVDAAGNVYVADSLNNRVVKLPAQ